MPQEDSERGLAAWLRRWWRPFLGEVVSTALLVLLGVASVVSVGGKVAPLAHPAFAFGLMVLVNVEVFGPVSGAHMNPAVTLTALLDRRLGPLAAAAYVVAQVFGALMGFALLQALAPSNFDGGYTVPHEDVNAYAAMCVEALLTGTLALLCCAVWSAHDASGPDRTVPLKFGLTVAGLVYAGGELTGASLNPARSLAPAILQGVWKHHWVYWAGPLGGAAAATLLHRALRAPPAPRRDVDLPLHDKPDH